jgi:hypothetical protein
VVKPRNRRATTAVVVSAALGAIGAITLSQRAFRTERPSASGRQQIDREQAFAPAVSVATPPAPSTSLTAARSQREVEPAPVMGNDAGASDDESPGLVNVTIKTVPPGAVIFRAGKRVGTSGVEVTLERDEKLRLTALLNGYAPANITLDGSRTTVTIMLRRAPKVEHDPDHVSDLAVAAASTSDERGAPVLPPVPTPPEGTTHGAETSRGEPALE